MKNVCIFEQVREKRGWSWGMGGMEGGRIGGEGHIIWEQWWVYPVRGVWKFPEIVGGVRGSKHDNIVLYNGKSKFWCKTWDLDQNDSTITMYSPVQLISKKLHFRSRGAFLSYLIHMYIGTSYIYLITRLYSSCSQWFETTSRNLQ